MSLSAVLLTHKSDGMLSSKPLFPRMTKCYFTITSPILYHISAKTISFIVISWYFSHRYSIRSYCLARQPSLWNPWLFLGTSAIVIKSVVISWHFSHHYALRGYCLALQPSLFNPWLFIGTSAIVVKSVVIPWHSSHLYAIRGYYLSLQLSRYSDWLRAGRSVDLIPVEVRFFCTLPDGPWAHPAPFTMGTGSFPGVKLPGRGANHPPPPSDEVEKQ
jgi:hypothetical protein